MKCNFYVSAFALLSVAVHGFQQLNLGLATNNVRTAPLQTLSHSQHVSHRLHLTSKCTKSQKTTPVTLKAASTGDVNLLTTEDEKRHRFRTAAYMFIEAGIIGVISGGMVSMFKMAIHGTRHIFYDGSFPTNLPLMLASIPAIGGLIVGLLGMIGKISPGLRGLVELVDDEAGKKKSTLVEGLRTQLRSIRKTAAAAITLGTGCSLGPEGPSVEIGMSASRLLIDFLPSAERSVPATRMKNRLLLACGAAAGVSAGFNAPIAGVFFALEIMQGAFRAIDKSNPSKMEIWSSLTASNTQSITALLLSSVMSGLVAKTLIGEHSFLTVQGYAMRNNLIELPLYLSLGAISGTVAYVFSQAAKNSRAFFQGEIGTPSLRRRMRNLPPFAKPALGGLFCGLVGLCFPQVLFDGHFTLNGLLANQKRATVFLLGLLGLKTATTAVAAGSGLVGGTFAPSLFLGAMTGGAFHNIAAGILHEPMTMSTIMMSDLPAYAMVGAASVLGALFRAPLTACLLLFELTRDYGVIVPIMASAGVASVVGDILENKQQARKQLDSETVSWGDLCDEEEEEIAPTIKANGEDTSSTNLPKIVFK